MVVKDDQLLFPNVRQLVYVPNPTYLGATSRLMLSANGRLENKVTVLWHQACVSTQDLHRLNSTSPPGVLDRMQHPDGTRPAVMLRVVC